MIWGCNEVFALDEELKQIPVRLERDRQVMKRKAEELVTIAGEKMGSRAGNYCWIRGMGKTIGLGGKF